MKRTARWGAAAAALAVGAAVALPAAASTLGFSTYLGGGQFDAAYAAAAGSDGSVYVVGVTRSNDFPLVNPGQGRDESRTDADMFVSRFLPSGEPFYSTYLGGTGDECTFSAFLQSDNVAAIVVDSLGCAVVVGQTLSEDFPTRAPLQPSRAGIGDAVVAKLSPTGSDLIFSSYLGGSFSDAFCAAAFGRNGEIWAGGYTSSSDFPTRNPYQGSAGVTNACICRLTADGGELLFSTLLGGSDTDQAFALAADSAGGVWVAGATRSADFPVRDAWQEELMLGEDAFLAHLTAEGSALALSTYLGGTGGEQINALAVDSLGCAVAAGSTYSDDFPCVSAYQEELSGWSDGFVCRFSPEGRRFVYSTYLGGRSTDSCAAVAVDSLGTVYLAGSTSSADFPLRNAYDSSYDSSEAFVTVVPPWGGRPIVSTFLGGAGTDRAAGLAVDAAGLVHLAGLTEHSSDFPICNAYQSAPGLSGSDAFLAVLSVAGRPSHPGSPGDYDGDGASEGALFSPALGKWMIRGVTSRYFGKSGDIPVPADYDGDGLPEPAVFRPSTVEWIVDGQTRFRFGVSGDTPLPADYDGDGTCSAAVFRESSGLWAVAGLTRAYFGSTGDWPAVDDYDGDGASEIAVFRPADGLWAVLNLSRTVYGRRGQVPVPADYDGDGDAEIAVFAPVDGLWAVRETTRFVFGPECDSPVPADYDGDGAAEAAVYDDSDYLWTVRATTSFVYGSSWAIPVAR